MSNFGRFFSRVRLLWKYTKPFLALVFSLAMCCIVASVYLYLFDRKHFIPCLVYLLCPSLLAATCVFISVTQSEYISLAVELGHRRRELEKASLGAVRSIAGKILLNLQAEEPWKGSWLLPGGYYNPSKGDRKFEETIERRLKDLVASDYSLMARTKIASTSEREDYALAMLEAGHAPTYDHLYEIIRRDNKPIADSDVQENNALRWFSRDEVESGHFPIPPHMKDIVSYLLGGKGVPKFWNIDLAWGESHLADLLE